MRKYCQFLGLINLLLCAASSIWLIAEGFSSAMPALAALLSFNMAMAWLFLSGVHRNAANERVWHFKPAFETIVLFLVIVAVFFAYAQKS